MPLTRRGAEQKATLGSVKRNKGKIVKRWGMFPIPGKGETAQVTKVDDRGRIKLSKEIAEPGSSIVIVDAQSYFLGIPIQRDPVQSSGSWMKTKESLEQLKKIAEEEASKDSLSRAKRRRQL